MIVSYIILVSFYYIMLGYVCYLTLHHVALCYITS